jgi:hypothetical protein
VTAPTQTDTSKGTPDGGKKQQVMLKPFRTGAQPIDEDVFDRSVTLNAGTQSLDQYNVPSTAYLNGIYILIENTVTSSTATATSTSTGVGVLSEDGPYNVIDNLRFTDTSSNEIIGEITGWDLAMIHKWGGYAFNDDPEANTDIFTSTTNATASSSASGSFSFLLRIPVELVPRDALGSMPNKSSDTPYKVKISVAAIATVYANSATVGGSCRFRMTPESYWEPTATDGSGNPVASKPPGVNTLQYWNKTDYTTAGTTINEQLTNSVGYPIRNLLFILRDSNNSRSQGESDWPDPFKVQLQSNIIINRLKKVWKGRITRDYGYLAAGDAAGQKDNGVYVQPYNKDFGPKPGWETRRGYLKTTAGMRFQALATTGGSGQHKLTVLTNYVGVAAGTNLGALTT